MAQVKDWQSVVIDDSSTFDEAIKIINQGGYQLCLVCNKDQEFKGILTDSDIRKALLNNKNLSEDVSTIMNSSPLIVSPDLSEVDASRLMRLNQYLHLPIVSNEKKLLGLHILDEFKHHSKNEETLFIMAGGKGTRLMPLTKNLPKPMLPVQGKPILEHIIEKARLDGFQKIYISVNYLAEKITAYFQDGSKFGVNIHYVFEEEPLGTAGSLASLKLEDHERYIVVTNADLWTTLSFNDLLLEAKTLGTDGIMAVRQHEIQNPFGVVNCVNNEITSIEEKPINRYNVNAGIYVISHKLLDLLVPSSWCDMPELFQKGLGLELKLHAYTMKEDWVDIGRISEYQSLA